MSNLLVKKLLVSARALIADEDNWIKSSYEIAGRYCAIGAVDKAYRDIRLEANGEGRRNVHFAREHAIVRLGEVTAPPQRLPMARWVIMFNDNPETTHAQVLDMFDAVIGRLDDGQD